MNFAEHTILLVEDSPSQAAAYAAYLSTESLNISHVGTGMEALSRIASCEPTVILLDLGLPDISGLDLLRKFKSQGLSSSIIIITDDDNVETAVTAMRSGADDFLAKPFDAQRLRVTVKNALRNHKLENLVRSYHATYNRSNFHGLVGSSRAMQTVYHTIANVADSAATVFITGETGTGKELCAQALHEESSRADAPFLAINCAAIPRDLMESEIFGHVKGAFTGALADRNGAAYEANGGTLFLDEICEMSPDVQAKLLRFIQTGTFRKIGSTETETVDIRFVSATNRDPLAEVAAGRFREDLYYRLHVVPLELPALRDREDDLMLVANHFLQLYATEEGKDLRKFSGRARELLLQYRWPGNVRELQNVIRNVVVLNSGHEVTPKMLPTHMSERADDQSPIVNADSAMAMNPMPSTSHTVSDRTLTTIRRLDEVEREYIEYVIQTCDNNVPRAAAMLGVSPSTIYRKLQNWAA